MFECNDTRERLAYVAKAVGWDDPTEYNVAERDQINALAKEEDRNVELYPVIHAWRTNYHGGSQLTFWCKYCKDHHVHGRHSGPGCFVDENDNVVSLKPLADSLLAKQVRRGLRNYIRRFEQCTYNPNVPGGRGTCTCPTGSGDGPRAPHCWNREPGSYYEHNYILHEVPPDDPRATIKPKRTRK